MQPARLRLGQLLIDARVLTSEQLEEVLSQQLSVPWVSLYHIDFSSDLLRRVPRDVAEKYCLVPIYIRPVRGQGETLYVAMEDPMNEEALRECAAASGLPAKAMIAAPSDIARAIQLYYGGSIQVAPSTTVPSAAAKDIPSTAAKDNGSTERRPDTPPRAPAVSSVGTAGVGVAASAAVQKNGAPPSASAEDEDAPLLEVREVDLSHKTRKRGRQLTLLDGTTIKLPTTEAKKAATSPRRRSEPAPAEDLTAADLLAALRAAAHGVDSGDLLGESLRWEKAMAALLSLLLRKHLILERELLDELKKI
jgi:type IV pilus assembly protein PilB